MWPPLRTRSTMAQCSSRCCKCVKSRSANSRRRSPQPSNTARIARSRFPLSVFRVWRLPEATGFLGREPVPKPHTQLLGTFHTPDTGGEFGTEQASVCGLVGESSYRSKSSIDRSRREMPILQKDAVTGNDNLVERQSRLGAVPPNKFIDGVSDSHAWTRVNEGCPGPPICCDPDQEDPALSWAALVLGIFPCRVCSFQPPPLRLAKSLPWSLPRPPAHWAILVNLTACCPTSGWLVNREARYHRCPHRRG